MKKTEFVGLVATKGEMTKKDAEIAVNAVINSLTEVLENKDSISFLGFGSFSTGTRAAREQKVPSTGKVVQIPETTVAKFKAGKNLKEAINKKD
jgi:DNA-binding protein HU-beta